MRVTLVRYGGLAAGIRRQPKVVDTKTLSKSAAAELLRLVEAAKAEPNTEREGPGSARDALSYTITVKADTWTTTLSQSDPNVSPGFLALLKWLDRVPSD